jgi:hypothetical protein
MSYLAEYYLDIETYSPGARPDPLKDKIITIQFQQLDWKTGAPKGELRILTEWDFGSEEAMLDEFRKIFVGGGDWGFVPVGVNLYGFDLVALISHINKYFGLGLDVGFLRSKPVIDIKAITVIMNRGEFKGSDSVLGKGLPGRMIKELYEEGESGRPKIINYIKEEAKNFIAKYQILKRELPLLDLEPKGAA